MSGPQPERVVAMLTTEQFLEYWPKIEEALRCNPIIASGYGIDELFALVTSGFVQVWTAGTVEEVQDVIFARVNVLGNGMRILEAFAGFGVNLRENEDLLDAVMTRTAVTLQCDKLRVVSSRNGWEKRLAPRGFRPEFSVYERDVPKGGLQ